MRKFQYLAILFLCNYMLYSQTTISQGFEGVAGWNYTASGTVNTELARTGIRSLRLGRGNGGAGCSVGTDGTVVTFDPIYLIGSSCPGTFSFYHRTQTLNGIATSLGCTGNGEGLDAGEGMAVYVKLNGGAWTLIDSWSGISNSIWTWTGAPVNGASFGTLTTFPNPYVYNVPGSTTSVQFKILSVESSSAPTFASVVSAQSSAVYNRGDEGLFIDDVSFTTGGGCILPVTLTDFYAKPNESSVKLDWHIETEINVDHYMIERSNDGLNFETVSSVKSMAEANGRYNLNYSTLDYSPKTGINYYRLTNVDKDDSINHNKVIMVNFNRTHSSNVWINQTATDVVISFENAFKDKTFYLLDMNGKKIGEYKNLNIELNYFTINKLNLPKGLYVVGCLDGLMPPQKILIN